jgi:hypothetical protein
MTTSHVSSTPAGVSQSALDPASPTASPNTYVAVMPMLAVPGDSAAGQGGPLAA